MKICSKCGSSNTDWAHTCLKCHQPFQDAYQYNYPSAAEGTNNRPDGNGNLQKMGSSNGFQDVDASEFYTLIPDNTDQDTAGYNSGQTETRQLPQNRFTTQNSMNNNRGQNGSQNAGKKCRFCGTMNESVAAFCEYCGRPLNESRADRNAQPFGGDQGYGGRDSYQTDSYQTYQSYQGGASSALLDKFVSKMKISSTIWLILGIYQCVIGLPLIMFFGYGLTTIGLGVWNIIQSQKKKKMAEQYYQNPTGIVAAMESSQTLVIVFLLLNVFFGGFLGVAGAIYDLTIISFVTSNRQAFDAMGRQNYTAGGYNVYR
ncbi:MAG: hypothetical protein UIB39_04010 [Lachnospiraceae bacterium]|jgi:hypothetical protein|nr:hypothetical protein [Lachnospiraceae bacterium]